MIRNLIVVFMLFACVVSAQYYSVASAYPYLTGAYAPSPLAGGVPATVVNAAAAAPTVPVAASAPYYSAPAYSAPAYSAPAYSAPAYSAPAYSAPAYSAPAYSAPAYYAPSYANILGKK